MNIPLRQYNQLLLRYLKPQAGQVFLLGVLLLGSIALKLLNPQILRLFIDNVQSPAADPSGLLRLALLFLGVAFVQQIAGVAVTYYSENVGWTATNTLRNDLARHCLNLDLSFHNAHTPGEMIERIDGDITALSNFFSQFTVLILGNALLMVGVLSILFLEDWRVGLSISLFVVITIVVMLSSRNLAVPRFAAERQASAELFGFLEERMSGTEDIRANGAKAYVMLRFYQLMRAMLQKSLQSAMVINILLNTLWFLFSVGTAAAFATGAYLFEHSLITIGSVYVIFQYTDMLNRPISDIVHQIGDLQKAGASIGRVRQFLSEKSKLEHQDGDTASPDLPLGSPARPLAVEFSGVSVGYDDCLAGKDGNGSHEMVLQDISFRLQPGKVLGVLGRTGSGKTSLTRLLFRLYDPDRGAVRLGDSQGIGLFDLRHVPLSWVRSQVGMVTQNIQLFQASVRDNLTFFDRSLPDEKILEALRDLGLWEWYLSLPKGLDSELASGDGGLSAGEGQLLAFVRIFLREPGVVILDEASSRLDPATERLIEQAVDRLLKDRTAIIVAHRLGTVQRADEILILEDGAICEYGPRQSLLSDPASRFSQLMQTGMEEVLA